MRRRRPSGVVQVPPDLTPKLTKPTLLSADALKKLVFPTVREICEAEPVKIDTMAGGASLRRYHRVKTKSAARPTLIVMELGEKAAKSEEAGGEETPTELPFVNVQRFLRRASVLVPEIFRYDEVAGLLYLEDLGDITFESRVAGAPVETQRHYYQLAVDQLVALHRYARRHETGCIAFDRGFDYALLKWELDHFREYGLEAQGITLSSAERTELESQFEWIAQTLAGSERVFAHRDYQSRNIMVQDTSDGPKLRVIDFQDALMGTRAYDLVGLLRDSYVELPLALVDEIVGYFAEREEQELAPFRELFALQTVQRKLKDAGRFVFIDRKKGNPSFLKHIPSSLRYVRQALDRLPQLDNLRSLLGAHLAEFK